MIEQMQKQIMTKIKKIKCQQPGCRSNNQETLEIAVIGGDKLKRKGIMCTSCFIDQELFANIGNVQQHALSIKKFLKVLTDKYLQYREEKMKPDWPPTLIEAEKDAIKDKVRELDSLVKKGIFDIMKYLDDGMKEAYEKVKSVNHNQSLEKILEVVREEEDSEQERMKVGDQLKDISMKIVKEHSSFHLSTEEETRKRNEKVIQDFKKKVVRSRQSMLKLLDIHQKCLKQLIL